MKLFRFGAPGAEKPGMMLPDGARVDASGFCADWNESFFALGAEGFGELAHWVRADSAKAPRVPGGRPPRRRGRAAVQDCLHRPQLPRPRPRERRRAAWRADRVPEGDAAPSPGPRTICACRWAATRPTGRSSWRW